MPKDVEIGTSGSLIVAALMVAVALLLRSFYKRYTRLKKREEDESK